MPDHKFHGKWTSFVVGYLDFEVRRSTFDLNIAPDGEFKGGKRKLKDGTEIELRCPKISPQEITLKEIIGSKGTFKAKISDDLSDGKVKVLVGTATFPIALAQRKKAKKTKELTPGQNDGVWVGTQP